MLPNQEFLQQLERIHEANQRTLKDMFRNEICGPFLIDIKSRVEKSIAPFIMQLYDFSFSDEIALTGGDNYIEYEMAKTIVGVHHANTVFLTKEERSSKEKNEEYKKELSKQVSELMRIRRYSGAFFRNKTFVQGERYIYYPVPYMLFAMCTRMNEILIQYSVKHDYVYWMSLIMNKSTAALTLLEDQFLDSAYMPCRTVIEMFIKLMLFKNEPRLLTEGSRFAAFDLDKTCCSQSYSDEFNDAFAQRKSRSFTNKVDFLHYGFVDVIENYHDIVRKHPYSINGIIEYLEENADDEEYNLLERLKAFYTMCHGYIHGNVITARYPLLHYFEISLILGEIVPRVFSMICEEADVEGTILGWDILDRFSNEFTLLKDQYGARSTENFEKELAKMRTTGGIHK